MSTPINGPYPGQNPVTGAVPSPQSGMTGPNPSQNPGQYPPQYPTQFPPQYPQQFPGQPPQGQHPPAYQGQPYPQQPGQPQQGQPQQQGNYAPGMPPGPPPVTGPMPGQLPPGVSQEILVRASRATPFWNLVRVEFRKLIGTRSDKILLAVGPVVLIGFSLLLYIDPVFTSASDQISPIVYGTRVFQVVLHALLIKLIAGEWQHRSAQPTLLAQPSRAKYFLAQGTVVATVWLLCGLLQLTISLLIAPSTAERVGVGYLLGDRIGWVLGVTFLGALLTIMVALIASMLLPNSAGALAIYFVAVPAMSILAILLPKIVAWIDPITAAQSLAGLAKVSGPAPTIISLLLWLGLLGYAGYRVARRDVA